MNVTWDPAKNAASIAAGRPSFEDVARFDFHTAIFAVDDRRDYGEIRYRGLGVLDDRVHALVFVETAKGIRVISFRKANKREVEHYGKARQV